MMKMVARATQGAAAGTGRGNSIRNGQKYPALYNGNTGSIAHGAAKRQKAKNSVS